jgi:transcriptional regulator with XRE-family HTH domain
MSTDMASDLQVSFGERVRARRLKLGLTQAELAEMLEIHRPDLCDLEKGRHAATLATVEKIAKVLKVQPKTLIG